MNSGETELVTAREIGQVTGKHPRTVKRQAKEKGWQFTEEKFKGGIIRKYFFDGLPPEIQKRLGGSKGNGAAETHPPQAFLSKTFMDQAFPPASFSSGRNGELRTASENQIWTPGGALNPSSLEDPCFTIKLAALKEVDEMPSSWKKRRRAWIEAVGLKYGVHSASIYRWLKKREGRDIAGLRHTKASQGKPKSWDNEALEFWNGLILKREHRGINLKDLYYDVVSHEAVKNHWEIGQYRSAVWWARKINPLLRIFSRGGRQALDNALPPILRDYSDLAPFEILVGDQHRFDRWVQDDETGEIIRQEAYLFQDLRTRTIFGLAIARKYDSWLMGLALRLGIHVFGAFQSIYTDHGKPEGSRYLTGILEGMKAFGLTWEKEIEDPSGLPEADDEEINPCLILPGNHRKAIVRNAKSKLIERTFRTLESILESHFRLPGRTKRLRDDICWQDVDQQEAEQMARSGRLLLASDHALKLLQAADFYNKKRPHRGVTKEWIWTPKPTEATPFDCLKICYKHGWRPKKISEKAADLIFLAKDQRAVNRGRIEFQKEFYEHEALIGAEGCVDIRFNPMDLSEILVFHKGKYVCTAVPVEYSSMKNMDLAQRKSYEKRARVKKFSEEFKRLTRKIPDFREYSTVPQAERVAALVGKDRRKRAEERARLYRPRTAEELESEIRKNEEARLLPAPANQNPLPQRPAIFRGDSERYLWLQKYRAHGGLLNEADSKFMEQRMAQMNPTQANSEKEYWAGERELYEQSGERRG